MLRLFGEQKIFYSIHFLRQRRDRVEFLIFEIINFRAPFSAIFGDDYAELSSLRGAAIKKQEFEEVEQTSEYMETHYYQQTEL